MIESLQGELEAKSPASAVIRVSGVSFRLSIPLSTYEALPPVGKEARLLTHLHVREDALELYGFASDAERDLFRMLLGVSKIGPAVATRILSSCSPAEFKRHVLDEDADALSTMVKGIGPKSARRLVMELKGPVEQLAVEAAAPVADAARDAVQALVALGESRLRAERAVRAALQKLGPAADRQSLVEEALSQ